MAHDAPVPKVPGAVSVYIGGMLSIAIGVADAFYVHTVGWGPAFDEALVLAGLAAFGVHAAYSSGLQSDPTIPSPFVAPVSAYSSAGPKEN